jgi:hypothetical protein
VRDVLRDLTQEVALQQPVDPIQFLHSKIGALMGLEPSSSQAAAAAAAVHEQGVSSCRVTVECVGPAGKSCQQHLVRRSAVGSDKVLSEWRGEAEALVRRAFEECTDAHDHGNGGVNGNAKANAVEAVESAPMAQEGTESELSAMRKALGAYKEKLELAVARGNRLESSLREAEYKTSQMVARSQMKQSISSQRRASLPMDMSMITVDGSVGATSRLESGATEGYAPSRAASQTMMPRGSLGGTGEDLMGVDETLGKTMSSRQPRQTVRIGALRSMPSVVTWWQQPLQKWGVLVMMRHGGTKYNEEGRLTGWTDPDLSEEGASTSKESGMQLRGGTKFDLVITSTLKRSVKTAMHVLEGKDAQHVPIIKVPPETPMLPPWGSAHHRQGVPYHLWHVFLIAKKLGPRCCSAVSTWCHFLHPSSCTINGCVETRVLYAKLYPEPLNPKP